MPGHVEFSYNMISKDIYLGYSTLRATSQVSVQKEEKYEKACLIISQLPVHHFGDLKLVWLVVLTLNRFPKQCIKTHHQKHAESLVREGEDMR